MVIGERICYGIYPGLDLVVLYIRLFDLKNTIISHEMGQNRRQIFFTFSQLAWPDPNKHRQKAIDKPDPISPKRNEGRKVRQVYC